MTQEPSWADNYWVLGETRLLCLPLALLAETGHYVWGTEDTAANTCFLSTARLPRAVIRLLSKVLLIKAAPAVSSFSPAMQTFREHLDHPRFRKTVINITLVPTIFLLQKGSQFFSNFCLLFNIKSRIFHAYLVLLKMSMPVQLTNQ